MIDIDTLIKENKVISGEYSFIENSTSCMDLDVENREFVNCKFKHADFSSGIFRNCIFRKVEFEDCAFVWTTFHKCVFEDTTFLRTQQSMSLYQCTIESNMNREKNKNRV